MRKHLSTVLILMFCISVFSQERFLQYSSKDTINGKPKVKGSLGVNLKLNGYYDFFGGLQDSETFNVGAVNVFGTDDTGRSFNMMEDGSETMSREEMAQLAVRQEKFIQNLKNALIRIKNKTYGICRVSGKLIQKQRLRLVPHATLSIEAKRAQG